jgi:hypothetical protein
MGGLDVIGMGAGGSADSRHRDARHKRYRYDFDVRGPVRGVDRVVHVNFPAAGGRPFWLATDLPGIHFWEVSRVPQNGFIGRKKAVWRCFVARLADDAGSTDTAPKAR